MILVKRSPSARNKPLKLFILLSLTVFTKNQAQAQAIVGTEQFHEIFATAGYSAVFGAAIGTAMLPFIPQNTVSNLRVVSGGASIGFVLGSALALYSLRRPVAQAYGMPYSQPQDQGVENGNWGWDLGSSDGKDVYVQMNSRF
ncbi:MAG: hypothetical protein RJB13_1155 [Pseudomonadota bacterium]